MTGTHTILSITSKAYVICYKEDVSQLVSALEKEGFNVVVNRQQSEAQIDGYSSIVKCLVNHYSVWEQLRGGSESAIIVEADFVPTLGMGNLMCPFPPDQWQQAFGYLYGCGIEIYDLVDSKYARGHSGATVAYYISPLAAQRLCKFSVDFFNNNDPTQYSTWDTKIRKFIQDRGVNSFVPYRNFGEHGGLPNTEHHNVGLSGTHRADVLAGPLHFLPNYANNNYLKYVFERFKARCWGIGRILFGKFLKIHDVKRQDSPYPILGFVLKRQAVLIRVFRN